MIDGTSESLFQAGVGYTRRDDSSMLHLGASKNVTQTLGVGLGGKFIFPNDSSGSRINEASLSVSGIPTKWFQSSLIVDNLFEAATSRGLNREFILGTKFNINGIVLIYLDPHWIPTLSSDVSTWGYEAGVEFPFFTDFFLRLGKFNNATVPYQAQRGDGYGFGVGWVAPKISFDYSFSRVTGPLSSMAHNFGVSVFY